MKLYQASWDAQPERPDLGEQVFLHAVAAWEVAVMVASSRRMFNLVKSAVWARVAAWSEWVHVRAHPQILPFPPWIYCSLSIPQPQGYPLANNVPFVRKPRNRPPRNPFPSPPPRDPSGQPPPCCPPPAGGARPPRYSGSASRSSFPLATSTTPTDIPEMKGSVGVWRGHGTGWRVFRYWERGGRRWIGRRNGRLPLWC